MKTNQKGFTLIGLMVVLSVLAILSSIYYVSILKKNETIESYNLGNKFGEFIQASESYYLFNDSSDFEKSDNQISYLKNKDFLSKNFFIPTILLDNRPVVKVTRISEKDKSDVLLFTLGNISVKKTKDSKFSASALLTAEVGTAIKEYLGNYIDNGFEKREKKEKKKSLTSIDIDGKLGQIFVKVIVSKTNDEYMRVDGLNEMQGDLHFEKGNGIKNVNTISITKQDYKKKAISELSVNERYDMKKYANLDILSLVYNNSSEDITIGADINENGYSTNNVNLSSSVLNINTNRDDDSEDYGILQIGNDEEVSMKKNTNVYASDVYFNNFIQNTTDNSATNNLSSFLSKYVLLYVKRFETYEGFSIPRSEECKKNNGKDLIMLSIEKYTYDDVKYEFKYQKRGTEEEFDGVITIPDNILKYNVNYNYSSNNIKIEKVHKSLDENIVKSTKKDIISVSHYCVYDKL